MGMHAPLMAVSTRKSAAIRILKQLLTTIPLQRLFSVLTKLAHVESRLSGRKRQREVVFTHPQTFMIEEHVLQVSL
jgi:hypothetical protein